jgi:hypothetical protein
MKPNLEARAGRWSAAHWKTATFGWLASRAAGEDPRRRRVLAVLTYLQQS